MAVLRVTEVRWSVGLLGGLTALLIVAVWLAMRRRRLEPQAAFAEDEP